MKKILLTLLIASAYSVSNAQSYPDDFETYTLGDIGTTIDGTTFGQGLWVTYIPGGAGSNSDFQVVNVGAPHNNCLQVTSGATSLAATRVLNAYYINEWAARDAGNDVAHLEVDFYTGAPQAGVVGSKNISIFSATVLLGGYSFNPATGELRGTMGMTPIGGQATTYPVGLGTGGNPLILNPNTWYRLAVSFNKTTGRVTWKSTDAGVNGYYEANPATHTGNAGSDIQDIDFFVTSGTNNSVASNFIFDNLNFNFSATDALGVEERKMVINEFSVYPNPVKNVVNVSNTSDALISEVEIADINGRIVKNIKLSDVAEAQISVSELAQGIYTMRIVSDKGTITKKIIKE